MTKTEQIQIAERAVTALKKVLTRPSKELLKDDIFHLQNLIDFVLDASEKACKCPGAFRRTMNCPLVDTSKLFEDNNLNLLLSYTSVGQEYLVEGDSKWTISSTVKKP